MESLNCFERETYLELLSSPDSPSSSIPIQNQPIEKQIAILSSYCYKKLHSIFNTIYQDLSTDKMKALAKSDCSLISIETNTPPSTSLTYGEIDFYSFADILERIQINHGDTFVDLGCGTGKALITAALLFGRDLARIHGIELLPSLVSHCEQSIKSLQNELHGRVFQEYRCQVTCQQGDITTLSPTSTPSTSTPSTLSNWTTADIIFINSTLFDDHLWATLAYLVSLTRTGTRIITLTKSLGNEGMGGMGDRVRVVDERVYRMSWGAATAFFHVKI